MEEKITFKIEEEVTLINFLKTKLTDMSNKTIKQYINNYMVKVNKNFIKNATLTLKKGDIVSFYYKKNTNNSKLHIIYEDDKIIVINKPSGLLSIGNDKEKENTAYKMMSDYYKKENKNNRIFVVHRLDEDTSGVLMFAKSKEVQEAYQSKWNELISLREYYCVVPYVGIKKGTIKSYLKVEKNQQVHSVNNKNYGDLAITNYECVKKNSKYSLVRVWIETGKRNQIRVHMMENFKPICGDKKYGSIDNPLKRLCLHASKLAIKNPFTNKEMVFESQVPVEMMKLVD